jgi:hypothetical protein
MKKTMLVSLLLLLIPFGTLWSQITLESDYEQSGAYTQLTTSGNKFFVMDVLNNQCKIYNTDHSVWKTVALDVPAGQYLYDIRYVSEGLFTNDNSLSLCYIYYLYDETFQYYTYTLKIIKEDGTVLLTIAGAQYLNIVDLGEDGTKMVAYVYDYSFYPYTILSLVYDLPGQLVSSSTGSEPMMISQAAFPNPATDYTTIPINLPKNNTSATLTISDATGRTIKSIPVDQHATQIKVNTGQLPKGLYLYTLQTESFKSEARKIIVK